MRDAIDSPLERLASSVARLAEMPIAAISVRDLSGRVGYAVAGVTEQTSAIVNRLCAAFSDRDGTSIVPIGDGDRPLRAGLASALCAPDGTRLGTLLLFDTHTHNMTSPQLERIADAAGLATDYLIARCESLQAREQLAALEAATDDLTDREHSREVERRLMKGLELTANDAPIAEILEHLVESVEFSIPEGICTILRCRGNALVHVASGPALPKIWIEAIGQARIGPSEGSCGTAAYLGETVVVSDIATDSRWEILRPLALELGLRACWSAPIRNARGVAHGTLAVYSGKVRVPTEHQLGIMHEAANLASIAIEANQSRERLEDLASRDTLTGLPNRACFQDRLSLAIATAKSARERVFVGLLDLDRFKIVNDSLGHMVGDQLLVEVAQRLRAAARPQDTIARMGGDEFLFLLTGIDSKHDAEGIARRVLAELDRSFSPSGNELFVHASLGFSVYPDDALDPTQLLSQADRAMYDVKAL